MRGPNRYGHATTATHEYRVHPALPEKLAPPPTGYYTRLTGNCRIPLHIRHV